MKKVLFVMIITSFVILPLLLWGDTVNTIRPYIAPHLKYYGTKDFPYIPPEPQPYPRPAPNIKYEKLKVDQKIMKGGEKI